EARSPKGAPAPGVGVKVGQDGPRSPRMPERAGRAARVVPVAVPVRATAARGNPTGRTGALALLAEGDRMARAPWWRLVGQFPDPAARPGRRSGGGAERRTRR